MCKKRCPHIELPPNARVGIAHTAEKCTEWTAGEECRQITCHYWTILVQLNMLFLTFCLTLSIIMSGDNGWHYVTRWWLSLRSSPGAINHSGETALRVLMNFSHATTNARYSAAARRSFWLQAEIWRHLSKVALFWQRGLSIFLDANEIWSCLGVDRHCVFHTYCAGCFKVASPRVHRGLLGPCLSFPLLAPKSGQC